MGHLSSLLSSWGLKAGTLHWQEHLEQAGRCPPSSCEACRSSGYGTWHQKGPEKVCERKATRDEHSKDSECSVYASPSLAVSALLLGGPIREARGSKTQIGLSLRDNRRAWRCLCWPCWQRLQPSLLPGGACSSPSLSLICTVSSYPHFWP